MKDLKKKKNDIDVLHYSLFLFLMNSSFRLLLRLTQRPDATLYDQYFKKYLISP